MPLRTLRLHPTAIASASLAAVAAAAVFYVLRRRRIARVVELRSAFLCEVARTRLPAPFDSWEDICEQLPCLNKQRTIRSVIDSTLKVHRVVHSDLTLAQVRRARVMLGCMIASYVKGEQVPWEHLEQDVGLTEGVYPWYRLRNGHDEHTSAAQSPATAIDVEAQDPIQLPPSLGVPWRDVSEMLGLPPILTATDLDLWNRGGTDVSRSPRDALRGFRQMVSITGTRSERGFHAVPFTLQLVLAPLLPSLLTVPDLVARGDSVALQRVCAQVDSTVSDALEMLRSIYSLVDVSEFYDVYRPLLGGWAPRGLQLPPRPGEGPAGQVAKSAGPSAGQTAIFIVIDLALGVDHGPKLKAFQHEMREYLPREHRALIEALDAQIVQCGSARTAATAEGAHEGLVAAHASALRTLARMRAYHLGIATHYLKRSLKGTGGSDFRAMLDEGLRSTRASAVNATRGAN